jgi:hypothetical protein
MLKEEKAFLVVMSIAIGTMASSVAIIGRYLPLAHGLLLGLAISLFYPVFIIAMVRFSMALKSWSFHFVSNSVACSGNLLFVFRNSKPNFQIQDCLNCLAVDLDKCHSDRGRPLPTGKGELQITFTP